MTLPGGAGPSGPGAVERWAVEGGDRSPQVSHKSQLCGQGAVGGQGPGGSLSSIRGTGPRGQGQVQL